MTTEIFSLAGKAALVTGGSRGIGAASYITGAQILVDGGMLV